jgi:hypothetical protein
MPAPQKPFDISVRLPGNKKYLKDKLVRIAAGNCMSLTHLVVIIIEQFLASTEKKISINLK